jgi:hypothetical protein
MSGFEIEKEYLLEKFTGKGAWTYALIPEIAQNKNNPFGWVAVSGFIDTYELNNYKLMPFGQGLLFLPLSAKVRKLIKKEAGDSVLIKLNVLTIPDKLNKEVIECLNNESEDLLRKFYTLDRPRQNNYIKYIFESKTEVEKADRIIELIDLLSKL